MDVAAKVVDQDCLETAFGGVPGQMVGVREPLLAVQQLGVDEVTPSRGRKIRGYRHRTRLPWVIRRAW
ncbi:hypothetical protein [Amycolatopsis aidingensis]|uniref:hypothetical protein n=1 Tax=Amycolatopsis aidingensis TaxID=2842453 RepID=UPI001C0C41B8|nr:hypothetical protein [Amycolatopsis aidingensis]